MVLCRGSSLVGFQVVRFAAGGIATMRLLRERCLDVRYVASSLLPVPSRPPFLAPPALASSLLLLRSRPPCSSCRHRLQNLMKEMPYGVIAGGEDVPAAIAAVQFASGDAENAKTSLSKVPRRKERESTGRTKLPESESRTHVAQPRCTWHSHKMLSSC